MSINVYFLRVFKYLLKMVILLSAVFTLMLATGAAEVGIEEFVVKLFASTKGTILIGALLIVAFTYPKFGYAKRTIRVNADDKKEQILDVMDKGGYSIHTESSEKIVFQATSIFKRITMLGDDKIILEKECGAITINGVRKDIALAEYRLKALIERE